MRDTVLHDMFTPALLVSFDPVSNILRSVSIVEEFDGSSIAVEFVIGPLSFLDMDIMFSIDDLPTDSVKHIGVLVDLSVRVRFLGFEGINFDWGSILGFVNVQDTVFDHLSEVHDSVVSKQRVGFVEFGVV